MIERISFLLVMLAFVPTLFVYQAIKTIARWVVSLVVGILLVFGVIVGLTVIMAGGFVYSLYVAIKRVLKQ